MKKILMILIVSLVTVQLTAQDKYYVEFFFGTVKNANVENHIKNEKETFAKIHGDRIKRGEIVGWDMWQMVSPGDTQGTTTFMYATIYKDFDKANSWTDHIDEYVKRIAGNNAPEFRKKVNSVMADYTTMNDVITSIKGEYSKSQNTNPHYLVFNSMAVNNYRTSEYEEMENNTFKSYRTENKKLLNWDLHKVLNVSGENKINYYTADFYEHLKDIYEDRDNTSKYSETVINSLKEIEKVRVLKSADIFQLIDSKR
jgi:transcriptional regulator NrdR family protein